MDMPIAQPMKRPIAGSPISPLVPTDSMVNLSFNVPFSSSLAGPDPQEILHASPDSLRRWTFPEGTEEGTPMHKLPVHANNVEQLRQLCRKLSEGTAGRVEASVTSSEPKPIPALQRRPLKGLVTNVCVSGDADTTHKMRAKILNETPIALVRIVDTRIREESADRGNRSVQWSTLIRTLSSTRICRALGRMLSITSTSSPSSLGLIYSCSIRKLSTPKVPVSEAIAMEPNKDSINDSGSPSMEILKAQSTQRLGSLS